MKRKSHVLSAAVEALEIRRLFATLVVNGGNGADVCKFEVDSSFIYATMNGVLIPQPVGNYDDVQINLFDGNDLVTIVNTGDEPVVINMGNGTDLIQISTTTQDLDSIDSRVVVNSGTDGLDDLIHIRDDNDTGSDDYLIDEPGIMRLRKIVGGVTQPDKVLWGESNINAALYMNDANNTLTVNSTVAMGGTDERLSITGGEIASGDEGGSGGNDTVNFQGTIGGDNSIYFHGGSGTDAINVNTASFTSNNVLVEMRGGTGFGDALNITDPNPTTRYSFPGINFLRFFESTTQTAEFIIQTDLVNINSTHATQGAEYEILVINDQTDVVIDAGAGDDTLTIGDNFITTELASSDNIDFDGGTGVDAVEIHDASFNAARDHIFSSNTYNSDFLGVLNMSSVSNVVLFAGDGGNNIDVGGMTVQTLELNGGTGADVFDLLVNLITNIEANGSSPVTAPGDVLFIDPGSATGGIFTPNGASGGTYDYDARSPIVFTGMEQFPTGPTQVPTLPNLNAAHDSGVSNSDNITNLTTLTFTGTGAPGGSSVSLFRDNVEVASTIATTGGSYTFLNVAFPTGDDTFAMTTRYYGASQQLFGPASPALSVRVDTVAPANPSAPPDLAAGSDSGLSSTDNITNDSTPTITGTTPGDEIVRLFDSGSLIGSDTNAATGYSITPSAMANGTHHLTVLLQDLAGNQSAESGTLSVTIDTVAPAALGATDLLASSDSGSSSTDNITNDNTPTFAGTSISGEVVRIFSGSTLIGSDTDLGTAYSITSGILADGTHSVTAKAEDLAGNQSAASPALSVFIDTAAPATPSAAPDLDSASDTGVSSTDNITRDNTPTFTGTAPINTLVRLFSSGGILLGSQQLSGAQTTYGVTSTALADGNASVNVRFVDLAGNSSAASALTSIQIDTVSPSVSPGIFNFLTTTQSVQFTYSENVSATITASDLNLLNGGTPIPTAFIALSYTPNVATFTFPGFINGMLPNGSYNASIQGSNVTDVAGNNSASANLNFSFVQGDADGNGVINFDDYAKIDAGFNQGLSGFGNGDFNYDGLVNFDDYSIIDLAFNNQRAGASVSNDGSGSPFRRGRSLQSE